MPQFNRAVPMMRQDADGKDIPFRLFVGYLHANPIDICNGRWKVVPAECYGAMMHAVKAGQLGENVVSIMGAALYEDGELAPIAFDTIDGFVRRDSEGVDAWALDELRELAWADLYSESYLEAFKAAPIKDEASLRPVVMTAMQTPGEPVFTIPPGTGLPTWETGRGILADNRDWGHRFLGIEELHARGIKGDGALVAICDTGVDYRHRDLSGNERRELCTDLTGSRSGYSDLNGHGTHCSGIVGADDDGGGMIGVAPDASLMAVKVLSDRGSGLSSWIAAGIRYAADKGADVISLSLGGPSPDSESRSAIEYAVSKGAWVVAAAGNDGGPSVSYPGHYPNVLAVCAIDQNGVRAGFSTINRENDISAPGVQIVSTLPGDRFGAMSGTSMATPYVAGCLALVRAELKKRGLPIPGQMEMIKMVRATADDIAPPGDDPNTGAGSINPARLLEAMIGGEAPPPPPPPPSKVVIDIPPGAYAIVSVKDGEDGAVIGGLSLINPVRLKKS